MSLPKPDLHVRLSHEAKASLSLLADVYQVPESVLAGKYLEEVILGRAHALKVAAREMHRQGLSGSDGDE